MEATVAGITAHQVDEVVVEIDYEIIEHFSQNLYGSPNKAVEELVANGYDALATAVYVYAPGAQVGRRVLVWDDGASMDVGGLKELWHIAHSPKVDGSREVSSDRVATRSVIGKFGIGKLASYQVGHRITHLCKQDDRFLLISLDYREIREDLRHDLDEDQGAAAPAGATPAAINPESPRFRAPIIELNEAEARAWADQQFLTEALAFDALWDQPTWTLAVVDELKDVSLPAGRLRWVLGNGMPLRPDFKVFLDDEEVQSKLGRNADLRWQLDEQHILSELASEWSDARDRGLVSGDTETGLTTIDATGAERPAIRLPQLGVLSAEISLFSSSLATGVAAEHGRSHGFFVMVRDRLLNPDDPAAYARRPIFRHVLSDAVRATSRRSGPGPPRQPRATSRYPPNARARGRAEGAVLGCSEGARPS